MVITKQLMQDTLFCEIFFFQIYSDIDLKYNRLMVFFNLLKSVKQNLDDVNADFLENEFIFFGIVYDDQTEWKFVLIENAKL